MAVVKTKYEYNQLECLFDINLFIALQNKHTNIK